MNGTADRAPGLATARANTEESSQAPLESTHRLLARARQGDAEALDMVLARYLLPLRRWARGRLPRYARSLVDTDDLVQETLVRTVRRVAVFDPHHSGAFRGYLHRGILNQVRDEIRRAARRPNHQINDTPVHDDGPSPLEEAIGRESMARYEATLEKLQPTVREAVIARLELGLGYAEIAATLGKPSADAARMTVSRALLRLAREMSRGQH